MAPGYDRASLAFRRRSCARCERALRGVLAHPELRLEINLFEALGETVEDAAAQVHEHEDPLAEGLHRVKDAVQEVREGVNGRLEHLARFTFV